jgi:hypothetical protein
MIFLQGFIKFDQGISEKSDGQNCAESGIIRIVIITRIAIAQGNKKKEGFQSFFYFFPQTS